jgi:hypothetical protein
MEVLGGLLVLVIAVAAVVGLPFLIARWEWRNLRAVTSGSALRHLRRSAAGTFDVELRGMSSVWDPAPGAERSVSAGRIYGPGHARYTLADDGTVTLQVIRPDGAVRTRSGPVPPRLLPGTEEAARLHRSRRAMWATLAAYPAAGVLGAVLGYRTAGQDARAGHAFVGFLVGFLAIGVVLHVAVVVLGASGVLRRDRPAAPHDDPADGPRR